MSERSVRLAQRANRIAQQCAEIARIDTADSQLGRETATLCNLLDEMRRAVDAAELRLESCLRIMETIFDVQEQNILLRQAELKRHRSSCDLSRLFLPC